LLNVSGMEQLQKQIKELGAKGNEIRRKAELEAGNYFADKLKQNTPKGDSNDHAADHIIVVQDDEGVKIGFDEDHFYMMFVEWGTENQAANPFTARTFENSLTGARNEMVNVINKEMSK